MLLKQLLLILKILRLYLSLLTSKNFRHLPVVENDKVLGILSLGDLAKETIDYQQRLIKKLESYINS